MKPISLRALGVVGISTAAVLALAPSAFASSVKIGSTIANAGSGGPGNVYVQRSTGTGSPSYAVPAGGTRITSFSVQGNPTANVKVALVVFRKTSTANQYLVVGESSTETLTASKLNTFTVSLAVHPGDRLGLDNVGNVSGAPMFGVISGATDTLLAGPGSPMTGSNFTFNPAVSPPGYRLNVSAVVQLAPSVTSISPTSGPAGTLVTITGKNFTGATKVEFGSAAHLGTSLTVVSSTEITVKAPSGVASGTVTDVRVLTPGGLSAVVAADKFTFS